MPTGDPIPVYCSANTGQIWGEWNSQYYGYGSNTGEATGGVLLANYSQENWNCWNAQYLNGLPTVTVTANSAEAVWVYWNEQVHAVQLAGYHQPVLTQEQYAEQVRLQQEQTERARVAAVEAAAKRAEASKKAEELLFMFLTAEQKAQYRERGYFETLSHDGKRYRIRKGRSGNVKELDETGREKYSFCIHPYDNVPDEDTMLTQLLMLTNNADEFRSTANRTTLFN